jgi:hypothetical protein
VLSGGVASFRDSDQQEHAWGYAKAAYLQRPVTPLAPLMTRRPNSSSGSSHPLVEARFWYRAYIALVGGCTAPIVAVSHAGGIGKKSCMREPE